MGRTFGGLLFYNASQGNFIQSAGTVAYTRNAAGDTSINVSASSTVQAQFGVADIKRPYITWANGLGLQGTFPTNNEFGQAFGAASGPGNPYSGGSSGAIFETPSALGGILIIDVFAVYSVGTNPLTTATIGLYRQRYAEGVANAQDVLVNAVAMTATATASATTCHVFKSTLAQPFAFESTDNSDLMIEVILAVPAGGTARLYGAGVHLGVQYA